MSRYTEIVELALANDPVARLRISAREGEGSNHAIVRVSSAALVDSDALRHALDDRYGRVMTGLARQLRAALHHDPLIGAYEIAVVITGRE